MQESRTRTLLLILCVCGSGYVSRLREADYLLACFRFFKGILSNVFSNLSNLL